MPVQLKAHEAPEAYEQICRRIECAKRVQSILLTHDIYDMPEYERRARTADVEGRLCAMDGARRRLGQVAAPEIAAAHIDARVEEMAVEGVDLHRTAQH